jgi:hypothetical protein
MIFSENRFTLFRIMRLIRQHEQSLDNRRQANQQDQQFEEISQPAIRGEPIDRPEADRSDNDHDQNADQNRNRAHESISPSVCTIGGPKGGVKQATLILAPPARQPLRRTQRR